MKRKSVWLFGLLLVQTLLLLWVSWATSPGWDEWAHLPSGLYTLQYGDHSPYCVNPPLTRLWCAIPVWLAGGGIEYEPLGQSTGFRPEWVLAGLYGFQRGEAVFFWTSLARTTVIPIALLGTWLIFCIGRRLFSERTAWVAATLWVFSPTVLTFGAAITPDVSAAVFGFWAAWCNYVWLKLPRRRTAAWLGVSLGLALLSKASWLILPPLLILIGLAEAWQRGAAWWSRERWIQTGLVIATSYFVVHAAYDFRGMLVPMGEFEFVSQALSGHDATDQTVGGRIGNRFRDSWWHYLPAPLPANYMIGIDLQKLDFEGKFQSYFWGQHRDVGWWSYYVIGIWLKEPVALWILVIGGLVTTLASLRQFRAVSRIKWRGRLLVLLPGVALLLFVSSQTGFNHHLRYVLPFLPGLYLLCAACINWRTRWSIPMVVVLLFWYAGSSLSIMPRSYAYFTEAIGGTSHGWKYLGNSNLDWGQDLLTIKRWVAENPDKRPVFVVYDPEIVEYGKLGIDARSGSSMVTPAGPTHRGWWIVGAAKMLKQPHVWFRDQPPFEQLSVTTTVYDYSNGIPTESQHVR
ncbi:MAG: glycosyltransferase family 39 protein [Pirellulaceae bacterium]|nr:glycosyltransferase family 39 protein [Pirellulaceae bacterium]